MTKNLDDIKKINPEEIKKNRKIVLSYIGDENSELTQKQKTISQVTPVINKVDGIKLNKVSDSKLKVKNIPEKVKSPINNQVSKQKNNEQEKFVNKEIFQKTKFETEEIKKKIKKEELIKKEIALKTKLKAEKKVKDEEAKKLREKLRLEEELKEEDRIINENKHLEKIKRAEEIKIIKQEIKLAKIEAATKRKLKRQEAIKIISNNLKNKLGKFFNIFKQNFASLIVFLVISYVIFCLLVLRFKINGNIIESITRILPVPAAITSEGIITYNDFRTINNSNYAILNSAKKKDILAKLVILKKLIKKYDLPVNSYNRVLAVAFATDEDFNQVGLARITKISELLKNVNDIEQFSKYADEYSDVAYYDSEGAIEKFGQAVFSLNANQISDIIINDNGYYILQITDNDSGQLGIKYLFVRAKTLDQYISEKLAKIKVFILIN